MILQISLLTKNNKKRLTIAHQNCTRFLIGLYKASFQIDAIK